MKQTDRPFFSYLSYESRDPQCRVAIRSNSALNWRQLFTDIYHNSQYLASYQHTNWALYHDDSYLFLVGLLSLLHLNKTVFIPGNNVEGTTNKLRELDIKLLGQFPDGIEITDNHTAVVEQDIALAGQLVIFTSGSTGDAKQIPKSLSQFENEAHAHASLWDNELEGSTVLATVSHQHIYGLIHKILWPFMSNRPFVTKTYLDPAALLADSSVHKKAVWISSPAHLNRCRADWPWDIAKAHLIKIFSSGGPLSYDAARQIMQLHHQAPSEIYGSSESGGIAWRAQESKTSFWTPLPGVDVKTDSDGALLIRSSHLPDQQWFAMADAATLLPDGRFQLGNRLDRIVKIEGKRLSLPEIENCLNSHPWIDTCRMVTLQQQRTNLAVAATLTKQGREQLEETGKLTFCRNLKAFLASDFDAVTLPRIWRFPLSLPTNSQGKIVHKELISLFDEQQTLET